MAEQNEIPSSLYGGYESDDVKTSSLNFGGNFGKTYLTKFEHSMNGGKGGTELEVLDITFTINGSPKSYRQFPVGRVYGKDNQILTSADGEEWKTAIKEEFRKFKQKMVHIVSAFVEKEVVEKALEVDVTSFKQYCTILMKLLPANFNEIPLDIFMHWQGKIQSSANVTFLEIPKDLKYGRFLCRAMEPVDGPWTKEIGNEGDLKYIDGANNEHKFTRSAWFMNKSAHAKQQKEDADDSAITKDSDAGATNGTPAANSGNAGW